MTWRTHGRRPSGKATSHGPCRHPCLTAEITDAVAQLHLADGGHIRATVNATELDI